MSIFSQEMILIKQNVENKTDCLNMMIDHMYQNGILADKDKFQASVYDRENTMSTGIGRGIAIPHGRCSAVNKLTCMLMTLENPIDFEAIDDEPVQILFMLAIPDQSNNEYMKILAQISKFMRDSEKRNEILRVNNIREAFNFVKGIENEI